MVVQAHMCSEKPSAYGSLVYGGYDQSRFVPNDITFPFDANDSRKPSTNIQSIVSRDFANTTVSMLPDGPAYSLIDFAEPHMWLPVSACDAFARAFNLTYDNSTDLYLVDASTRARLLERNPVITFGLGTTANPGERVNIVLPYSAFDQQATYPIYPNATNYFPIRRAYNDTQYTIGRTFFQEAYIRIDYDRGHFSVHQALFPATNEKQNIVPVLSPDPNGAPAQDGVHRTIVLTKSAIAGISIGGIVVMMLFIILACWLIRWRNLTKRKKAAALERQEKEIEIADHCKLETDGAAFYEKDGEARHELQTLPNEPEELNGRRSMTDLSAIVELYEMDNTEVWKTEEPESEVSLRNRPPPGWI